MSPLVRELLVNGLMAGTAVRQAKKTTVGIAYYAAAGVVGFLGIVFFAIAGYEMLLNLYSAPVAGSIMGGIFIVIAAAIAIAGFCSLHKKPVRKPHDGNFVDMVENTVKNLMEGFEEPVKDNPKMALLMAALAGFAAADKIGDRIH